MSVNRTTTLRPHWQEALRELATVIVGVLIALAVNNWSIMRAEHKLGAQYLQRLSEDLRRDSLTAATNLLPAVTRKLQAIEAVAPYIRRRTTAITDTLIFLKKLGNAGSMGVANAAWAQRTTFNEMNSTGNLRLIRAPDLRASIVRYYADMQVLENRVDARRSHYALSVHRIMPAELRDSLDLDSVRLFDINRLLSRIRTAEFEDELNQEINYALFVRLMVQEFTRRSNELLKQVQAD